MANLSNDAYRPHKGEIETLQYGVTGYTNYGGGSTTHTIYKGSIVIMDVSDVDGYAIRHLSTITATDTDVFLGVAMEQVAVTSSDTGDGDLTVEVGNGIFGFPVGSLAVTDIGADAYASDDQTITTTSSNIWVGKIVWVDGTYVWVDTRLASGRVRTAA